MKTKNKKLIIFLKLFSTINIITFIMGNQGSRSINSVQYETIEQDEKLSVKENCETVKTIKTIKTVKTLKTINQTPEKELPEQELPEICITSDMKIDFVLACLMDGRIKFDDLEKFIIDNPKFLLKTRESGRSKSKLTLLSLIIKHCIFNDFSTKCVEMLLKHTINNHPSKTLSEEYIYNLFVCAYRMSSSWINFLIEKGFDINSKNSHGENILFYIVRSKNLFLKSIEQINHLKELNIDLNLKNNEGQSVLHIAYQLKNNIVIIERLIELGVDINIQNNEGQTILHIAYQNKNINLIYKLLEFGVDVNIQNNEGQTVLHMAYQNKNINLIYKLLEFGVDVNIKDNEGQTVLHIACQNKDDTNIIGLLLTLGVDVNIQNNEGRTVLHIACQNKDIELIYKLLEFGAGPNIKDDNYLTPLMLAIKNSLPVEIMNRMIDSGADINIKCNINNWQALDYAINNPSHCLEHLYRILQLNPSISHGYSSGCTRLMIFLSHIGKYRQCDDTRPLILDIIKLFIELGVNLNRRNNDGKTAIHVILDGKFIYRDIFDLVADSCTDLESHNYKTTTLFSYAVLKLRSNDNINKLFVLKRLLDIPIKLTRNDIDNFTSASSFKYRCCEEQYDVKALFDETINLYNIQKMSNMQK